MLIESLLEPGRSSFTTMAVPLDCMACRMVSFSCMCLISSSQQSTDDVLGWLTLFNGAKPFSSSSFDSNPSECVDNLAIVVDRLAMPQAIADPAFAGVTDAFLDISELRSVTLYH